MQNLDIWMFDDEVNVEWIENPFVCCSMLQASNTFADSHSPMISTSIMIKML